MLHRHPEYHPFMLMDGEATDKSTRSKHQLNVEILRRQRPGERVAVLTPNFMVSNRGQVHRLVVSPQVVPGERLLQSAENYTDQHARVSFIEGDHFVNVSVTDFCRLRRDEMLLALWSASRRLPSNFENGGVVEYVAATTGANVEILPREAKAQVVMLDTHREHGQYSEAA